MNANVDYIIKTAIGEFNYLDYEGQQITATKSLKDMLKVQFYPGNTGFRRKNILKNVFYTDSYMQMVTTMKKWKIFTL